MLVLSSLSLSGYAKSGWLNQMVAAQETQVKSKEASITPAIKKTGFFSQHGFVLFYASTCPHCHHFAPVLKAFAKRHHAEVLPLSFDNQPLAEFPRFLPASTDWVNAAFKGQAINYPALFIANPKTAALYPVAFGSMTEGELEERMTVIMAKITEYENTGVAR
jgi:type-F conjugative transfer system pilin assembly thiol-disulfide isomerase TrbB